MLADPKATLQAMYVHTETQINANYKCIIYNQNEPHGLESLRRGHCKSFLYTEKLFE